MPSLLDLPDEHLIIIGSLLNPETYLPLASWKPFWNASKSPLDPKLTRHLRAFRATCRRIRGAVKLDGQFLEITDVDPMTLWASGADEDYEMGYHVCYLILFLSGLPWREGHCRRVSAPAVRLRTDTTLGDCTSTAGPHLWRKTHRPRKCLEQSRTLGPCSGNCSSSFRTSSSTLSLDSRLLS